MPAHSATHYGIGRWCELARSRQITRLVVGALAVTSVCVVALSAQDTSAIDSSASRANALPIRMQIGVMATGVVTRAAPAYNHRTFTELQLVQPVLMASYTRRRLTFLGALNAEGYTLQRGELNAGIWGEGYVDRRHPHTLVHEAMATWQMPALLSTGRRASTSRAPTSTAPTSTAPTSRTPIVLGISFAAGRGFVPFGSDDPMMRPFDKYPVNHHYSQILERIQAIGATRVARGQQALSVEGAMFNGDEPAGPFHGPRWSRFGDSWAIRATGQLLRGVELSASEASVVSPELQQGGAFDHRQHHASFRFERANNRGDARYVLAEWARTDEITNGKAAFRYRTALVEGQFGWRGASAALRLEHTQRGEQTRLGDPFRSPLGHVDFQNLGVTQWQVITVAFEAPVLTVGPSGIRTNLRPFVEVARANPTPLHRPTVFEPTDFYGASTLWSVSVGLRVHLGEMRARMGRYGVLSLPSAGAGMNHGMGHTMNHGMDDGLDDNVYNSLDDTVDDSMAHNARYDD